MRNKKFWIILILIVFALCSESIGVVDIDSSRETLKGIPGFYVLVDVSSDLQEIGINEERLRTDTELKLRLAGIRVLTMSETKAIPGNPALYVYILGLRIKDLPTKTYASYYQVSVIQNVLLERNPAISEIWIPTWGTDYISVRGSPNPDDIQKYIRDVNKDLIDKFINAYLSANPKGGK